MSKTPEQHAAWRDSYLYGRRDGSEAAPRSPRGGDAEAYELGYRWGVRHPVPASRMPQPCDVSGVVGANGLVYSDADPGL